MSRSRGLIALAALVLMSSSSGCADTQGGHGDGSTVGLGEVEVITDASTLAFNPTGEFVFPSVFAAAEHLADPLGEWYLYYAPHEAPGGIALMYADDLAGPWHEYSGNPLIANELPGAYSVSHVSSPDAIWNEEEERLFLYFHGENTTTRFATSADGLDFEYGGVAVENAGGEPEATESSYARVFRNPDSSSADRYVMLFMDNTAADRRRIRLARSHDGRDWAVREAPLIEPTVEGDNVSGANLWLTDGGPRIVYHGADGRIWQRSVNDAFTELSTPSVLLAVDGTRAAAPEPVDFGGETYLFFELGERLHAVVAVVNLHAR